MGRLTRYTDMELIRSIDTIENELYYMTLGKVDASNEIELEHDLSELKRELTSRHETFNPSINDEVQTMNNFKARIKLEEMFKDLSALRDTQDYYIKTSDDCDDFMDAIMTRDELNACLLTIKEIKTLISVEQQGLSKFIKPI